MRSEVTSRDDNHSEEDIPEEIILEDNCSEHSNREGDISFEGDFKDDLHDLVIRAEVTAKTETPDVASERDEIPEEMGTERDASENVVDNSNDDMADKVMEVRISPADDNLEINIVTTEMTKLLKTIMSRLWKLLEKLSMKMKVV